MIEILKTLKKHIPKIILVIIILVFMANCDLALPEYTSNIVNIGIQQNGIEDVVPVIITEETYSDLELYIDDQSVLSNYTMVSRSTLTKEEYEEYLNKYPLIEKEKLYELIELNENEKNAITNSIVNALLVANFSKQANNSIDINIIKNQVNNLESTVKEQYSINLIKEEYKTIGVDLENIQIQYILKTGIKMLIITLVSVILIISNCYLSSKISALFSKELRSKIVRKVMSFSSEEFDSMSASSLITRSTNDVTQIQNLITMFLRVVIFAPIIGIGAFFKVIDSNMAWVIGVAIIAIFIVILVLFFVALPNFKKVQDLLDKVNLVSREILTGIPVIRAFSNEKYEEKKFDKSNRDLTKVNLFVNKVMAIMMPTMTFIMNAICILIVWVGANKISNATMQVGDLMAFIQYSMQILTAFLMISIMSIMMPRAFVSIKRIAEIFNKEVSVKDIDEPLEFDKNIKGKLEFKNVSFKYPDAEENILSDISFIANKGETIAFVGSTGSGKSTLINLIPRFFDVTEGSILIDNQDIRNVKLKGLRDKIGFVSQKGILFSGTIKSNIKLSNDKLTDEEMIKACEVSQANEFILDKENKYDSEIAQNGNNVSGGQKQRLAIARAVAKNPEFYIFDDSFSALDFKTDAKLRKELRKYTSDATVIIVAQRISSIIYSDRIIVLEQGKVVGNGTHKELLNNCEVYKEIALSQLGEEELNNA